MSRAGDGTPPDGDLDIGMSSYGGAIQRRHAMKGTGPLRVRWEKLERKKTTRLKLEGFDLLIETPDAIEENEKGQRELSYPGMAVSIGLSSWLRAEMEQRPAAWGAGSYDKLLRIRRTMGDEVEGTLSLAKVRDVEVLGDGFVGLKTETWRVTLEFRPEHDPKPSLMMYFQSDEEPRDLAKAWEILESMSVVRPGE